MRTFSFLRLVNLGDFQETRTLMNLMLYRISLLRLIAIFATLSFYSARAQDEPPAPAAPSPWHTIVSAYGAIGGYSTGTDSRSVSAYLTFTNAWLDYYTLGYATLWLERSDAGGKYYSQQLISARGSWFVSDRVSLAGHYAYLDEGEIQFYSNPAVFHWGGAGGSYWFSPFQVAGTSFTLSFSGGSLIAGMYRAAHSFDVANGIWLTSSAIVTDADWTPRLFSFRQSVSVPLGNDSYLIASGVIGRRGFYLDDEGLIVYNQRSVQTGSIALKGVVSVAEGFYLLPAFEYNLFDEYNVKYGSIGVRAVF